MLTRHQHPLGDSHKTTLEIDRIAMIARLMITYGVSYECYHELRQIEKGLPPVHKVTKYYNNCYNCIAMYNNSNAFRLSNTVRICPYQK